MLPRGELLRKVAACTTLPATVHANPFSLARKPTAATGVQQQHQLPRELVSYTLPWILLLYCIPHSSAVLLTACLWSPCRFDPEVHPKPKKLPKGLLSWIAPTLFYDEGEMLKTAGMDVVVMVRLLAYGELAALCGADAEFGVLWRCSAALSIHTTVYKCSGAILRSYFGGSRQPSLCVLALISYCWRELCLAAWSAIPVPASTPGAKAPAHRASLHV